MHSHVQTCKVVYMSGVHCYMCAPSTSDFAFVYFTVESFAEDSSRVCLFQAQDIWKQA